MSGRFKTSLPEGIGHGARNLGFGQQEFGPIRLDLRLHLLLARDGVGPPLFGERSSLSCVGFGLIVAKASAYLLPNFDVLDVDRNNLESGMGVETTVEHGLRTGGVRPSQWR
jgi:hypothetical protein